MSRHEQPSRSFSFLSLRTCVSLWFMRAWASVILSAWSTPHCFILLLFWCTPACAKASFTYYLEFIASLVPLKGQVAWIATFIPTLGGLKNHRKDTKIEVADDLSLCPTQHQCGSSITVPQQPSLGFLFPESRTCMSQDIFLMASISPAQSYWSPKDYHEHCGRFIAEWN